MQRLLQTLTLSVLHSTFTGYTHHFFCHIVKQGMQLWLKQKPHITAEISQRPHGAPYMYSRCLSHLFKPPDTWSHTWRCHPIFEYAVQANPDWKYEQSSNKLDRQLIKHDISPTAPLVSMLLRDLAVDEVLFS